MPFKDAQRRKEYKSVWNKENYKVNRRSELERVKRRKQEMRQWFNDYKKTLKCSNCNESHPTCLDFHHKNRNEKSFNLSESIESRGYSKSILLAEMAKCIILCANCHRKAHSLIQSA